MDSSAISELTKKLNISISFSGDDLQIIHESEDKEFLELASRITGNSTLSNKKVSYVGKFFYLSFILCLEL